jgi:hypothetical protein
MTDRGETVAGYRRRLIDATKVGLSRRLGGRWGGLTLIAPLILGAAAGLLLPGNAALTGASVAVALVSGVAGVALWAFFVLVISFLFAPGEIDRALRDERDSLATVVEGLTRPRLRLTPRSQGQIGSHQASASLWVENVNQGEVRNCRGRLVGLGYGRRPNELTLDVPLPWTHPDHSADPTRKSFANGAELEVAGRGTPNYMIPAGATSTVFTTPKTVQLNRDVDNILAVEITADDMAPVVGWFRLNWRSHILIPGENGDPDTFYDLSGDQIAFSREEDDARGP